ncbi:Patatin [Rhodanobacter thiooxydans]|uniref:Patatin n=1 Tax=Rhodanobacter thiooxydans TaxID=416169 RepID=A0A154QLK4_9GAMM|nr:patatin-like phospholipase family protein [Rhodanobacter thiooxydans]EIL97179.1 patatin [Rhodanobacter thiooxydans LCS2]KZC25079.1 Patatin [Rhodanobacter thiooxydans]MCW0203830.1 patatin-like phospholipase family protein [Rhodanobacter thiooxydans]
MPFRRLLLPLLATFALGACTHAAKPVPPPVTVAPAPLKIGLALGGGAAKGFAHIGVIKMLEASGIHPDVVAGTSAGSVVGALYASGMDAFALQQTALGLDEAKIRDVRLFSGGLVQGQALQDYVNLLLHRQPIEQLKLPFAAVATELETGTRTVFVRGNVGRAVRASSSIPGVFEPVEIGGKHYVDGGVVSPIPVDAARQLGADFVIAVDISAAPDGSSPQGMMSIVGQSITIMGRQLAAQESARADVVIRPVLTGIGPTDFEQKNQAILAGEKAALAAIPAIRARLATLEATRQAATATR